MRNPTRILATLIVFALAALAASSAAFGQAQSIGALERGYRTGYSDGYQGGYSDSTQHLTRDYKNKDEYRSADRAYASSYGALEDYRDGYQQGFEAGYDAGFDHRSFDSTIPTNLSKRGTVDNSQGVSQSGTPLPNDDDNSNSSASSSNSSSNGSSSGPVNTGNASYIPANTVLRVELLTNLSTDATQKGDPFQARVIEPAEYKDAMIEGHVSRVKHPGKVKGNAELQLSFDKISMNGRWTTFTAQMIEVEDTGTSEGVGEVDQEGGVKGKDRTKDDVAKVGASTGVGAIIGAIFGGGKGAAIGAAIGGAVGTGSVITTSGKDIQLVHGQQLRIRTAREAHF